MYENILLRPLETAKQTIWSVIGFQSTKLLIQFGFVFVVLIC